MLGFVTLESKCRHLQKPCAWWEGRRRGRSWLVVCLRCLLHGYDFCVHGLWCNDCSCDRVQLCVTGAENKCLAPPSVSPPKSNLVSTSAATTLVTVRQVIEIIVVRVSIYRRRGQVGVRSDTRTQSMDAVAARNVVGTPSKAMTSGVISRAKAREHVGLLERGSANKDDSKSTDYDEVPTKYTASFWNLHKNCCPLVSDWFSDEARYP